MEDRVRSAALDRHREVRSTSDMGSVPRFEYPISEAIRAHATTFPETAEGSSCVNRAFGAGGKNVLFLGEKPGRCALRSRSADVWQKIEFDPDDAPPVAELEASVTRSFLLLAPKQAQCDHGRRGRWPSTGR